MESLANKVQIFLGDPRMLPELWLLSRNQGLGAFSPLTVHEIRLLKLVLEEPVFPGLVRFGPRLTADDEAFGISPSIVASLCNLVEEGLDFGDVVFHDIHGLLEAPFGGEAIDKMARIRDKFGKVEVDSMKIKAGSVRGVSENMLLEVIVTKLSDGRGIHLTKLEGKISPRLTNGGEMSVDPFFASLSVAEVSVISGTSGVLAAHD